MTTTTAAASGQSVYDIISKQAQNSSATSSSTSSTRSADDPLATHSGDVPLQGGKSKFDYKIEHASGPATLKILDASGNVVMLKQVDAAVGTHPVEWDGTDYFGNQLKDGKYTVAVSYTDQSSGKAYD